MATLLVKLGHDGARQELMDKVLEFDKDGTGRLSFNEFVFMAQVYNFIFLFSYFLFVLVLFYSFLILLQQLTTRPEIGKAFADARGTPGLASDLDGLQGSFLTPEQFLNFLHREQLEVLIMEMCLMLFFNDRKIFCFFYFYY